jgi:MFS family permease
MSRYLRTGVVDEEAARALLEPRRGLVLEAVLTGQPASTPGKGTGLTGTTAFTQLEGPLLHYARSVEVQALPDGRFSANQTVELKLGLPWWSWLLRLPLGLALAHLGPQGGRLPWWAPPARLDRRSACTVATLAALTAVQGFVGGLLPETLTYAASEFHSGDLVQGSVFAAVQMASVPALLALVRADRRGRRSVVLWATTASVLSSEASAASLSIAWLAAAQILAGATLTAAGTCAIVIAVEEVPTGCRAWAVGVLGMAAGLGAGIPLALLPLAGTGPSGWRWLFATSVACLPVALLSARRLPESRRWSAGHSRDRWETPTGRGPAAAPGSGWATLPGREEAGPAGANAGRRSGPGRKSARRLIVVCAGAALFALFATPAGQFQTQFLRQQRHYSAAAISGLQQLAGTLGGLGVLVGGRLADTRGRRPVGIACVAGATAATLAAYMLRSWPMWVAATGAQFFFYASTPVLGVYGAELFATASRARSAGMVAAASAVGGVAGLLAAGAMAGGGPGLLSGAGHAVGAAGLGRALAVLALGPVLLVALLVRAYPETAGRSLEDINGGQPVDDGGSDSGLTPSQAMVTAFEPAQGDGAGYPGHGGEHLVLGGEGVPGARDEETGHGQGREVGGP